MRYDRSLTRDLISSRCFEQVRALAQEMRISLDRGSLQASKNLASDDQTKLTQWAGLIRARITGARSRAVGAASGYRRHRKQRLQSLNIRIVVFFVV